MSDRDLSYSPEPTSSSSRKRKSTGSGATQPAKKPGGRGKKSQPDPYETAKDHVRSILASPDSFDIPEDEQSVREMFTAIAQYAKSLEGSVAVASRTGGDPPPPKTPGQIDADVVRIKNLIIRGVKKLMTWKPTAKSGRAKYAFDGVCPDPRVFGTIFGLDGPPNWKSKKFTSSEFEGFVGGIEGRARYSYLVLTSDVNVRYNPETGEFKISGSYGDPSSAFARMQYTQPLVNLGGGLVEPDEYE